MLSADHLVLLLAAAIVVAVGAAVFFVRRRDRETPVRGRLDHRGLHPALSAGLSELVAGQTERAIEHLREVVREDTDAVEVYVLLGDLYRDLGQVERALRIHRSVLNRSGLTPEQDVAARTSLARDHETSGFLDRARQGFEAVARLAPDDGEPLRHLRRLAERTADWAAALAAQERLVKLDASDENRKVLAFLQDRVGRDAAQAGDERRARRHFEQALASWPRCVPARIHLGDLHLRAGRTREAVAAWQALAEADPPRAWMVFERLDGLRASGVEVTGLEDWLRRLLDERPRDWRVRVFLAEGLAATGRVEEAREHLEEALRTCPAAATTQRAAWRLAAEHGVTPAQARRFADLLGDGTLAPERHACLHCRYRTDSPEWHCPHCHRWDAFVPDVG